MSTIPDGFVALTHADTGISTSWNGEPVVKNDDGLYIVPQDAVETMFSHGFEVAGTGAEKARALMIDRLMVAGRTIAERFTDEELARAVENAEREAAPAPVEPPAAPPAEPELTPFVDVTTIQPEDPNEEPELVEVDLSATPEAIAAMKRNELFAFVKARGVTVSLPISNDDLRKLALEAVATGAQ